MAGIPDFKFDLSIFEQVSLFDNRLTMNKMTVRVSNIQVVGYPCRDEMSGYTYPIYFEVTGDRYHYIVSAWDDKVEVEVCAVEMDPKLGFARYVPKSTCSPRNQDELLDVIETIARDFEDVLDKQAVA